MKQFRYTNPLLVFALEIEANTIFEDLSPIFVGVGKVNASYHLTKAICERKPDVIINLGSAGSNLFGRGTVVCCNKFVQRDMDASSIGCPKYQTPYSNDHVILDYGLQINSLPSGICGTGDSFDVNHDIQIYDLADMEAYALALISQKENIPFLCLKYISDGADDSAPEDWNLSVHHAAEKLNSVLRTIIEN